MIILTEPLPGIRHFLFDHKVDLAKTICRVQEFYESPFTHIKGQYFSMDAFEETYKDPADGTVPYYTYWDGFNFPLVIVESFLLMFPDLRPEERKLLLLMESCGARYFILTAKDSHPLAYPHELAHAQYFIGQKYREQAQGALFKVTLETQQILSTDLQAKGYPNDSDILVDEIQAYFVTSTMEDLQETFTSLLEPELRRLQDLFRTSVNYLPSPF